ncbi:MAG TPA: DoxX family protein [Acidimicrobiales bacterium]|nr:DoxX family protein [Acidimicrobiales bacterium]
MKNRDELLQRALALRGTPALKDGALVAARTALAWLFIYHGGGTLFGAFHGPGISRQAAFFSTYAGLHPGTFFAYLNGLTEFFGGLALAFGLMSRMAAFGLVCDMIIAMITVTWGNGIVSSAVGSGYELNVALAALAVVIVLFGAGRISLDYLVGTWWSKRHAAQLQTAPPAPQAASTPAS